MAAPTHAGSAPDNSGRGSNKWTTIKSGLVFGLKATEMALDGLPIPGVKGCVSLVLHIVNTTDLTLSNAEALEALQSRLNSLKEVLLPVYGNPDGDIPAGVRKDVGDLAKKLDKLAADWKVKLEKKHRKRDFIRRMFNAEDDQASLTKFANTVEQAIQHFLVVSTTNGRITASREELKNQIDRASRMLDRLPRAAAASYDCIRTGGANACLEGTRVSILHTIREWATNPDRNQPPMFWLNGLAGIGKTTIAHTIASELDAESLLAASFVFLRADDELKDARLVFPTLAFQLAQYNPYFRAGLVAEVLEQDPDCGSKLLHLQFNKLILQPFSAMSLSSPVVIILDALDECEPEKLTGQLLRILHKNIQSVPFLRVFITSRPEGYIREALDLVDHTSPHQKLVLHEDIHAEEVENDIRLFLQMRLQEIWDERTQQMSVRWPSERDLEKLVQQSGKLFVYAATAVRFIGGDRALNLNRQLSRLLSVRIGHIPPSEPYRQLDGLYLQILGSVFADSSDEYYIHRFRKIVGSIVLLERPLPLESLAKLLGDYSVEEIKETLYHLHSIIIVPATISEVLRTYHLSFPNFITSSDRCTNPKAYIDPGQQAKYLFQCCITVLERDFGPVAIDPPDEDVIRSDVTPQYANDITSIISSAEEAEAIDESSNSVKEEVDSEDYTLVPEVRYSDSHWCRHLMNIPTGDEDAAINLQRFIMRYLQKWLHRRKDRILDDFGYSNVKLAGDTFDIIHNVYHWGSLSGCSTQFQAFLRQNAQRLYAQLFPRAQISYLFGKPLKLEALGRMVRWELSERRISIMIDRKRGKTLSSSDPRKPRPPVNLPPMQIPALEPATAQRVARLKPASNATPLSSALRERNQLPTMAGSPSVGTAESSGLQTSKNTGVLFSALPKETPTKIPRISKRTSAAPSPAGKTPSTSGFSTSEPMH